MTELDPNNDTGCMAGREHTWEYFIADEGKGIGGGTPYYFCRTCKATLYAGTIRKLRAKKS